MAPTGARMSIEHLLYVVLIVVLIVILLRRL